MKKILCLFTVLFPILSIAQGLENVGESVNSLYGEYAPIISPDGKTLYFVREGHPENKGVNKGQNIWISQIQEDNTWGEAIHLKSNLNSERNSAILGVTPDGNTALIFGYYKEGVKIKPGFSLSKKGKLGWESPEGMFIEGFDTMNKGSYSSATLAGDGKTLIMAFLAKPEQSFDLFISRLKENGRWSRPQSLGSQINTRGGEVTPFIASDSRTLYFASTREDSYGSYDIYVSRRLDSTWQKWSEPINLGEPINDEESNIYFSIPASGETAYISTVNPESGNFDIFRIPVTESLRPEPVLLVYGKVYDAKTKEEIYASIVYESLTTGQEQGRARSNPNDGSYKITLPKGDNYGIIGEAEGYYSVSEQLDLSNIKQYEEIEKNLYLMPIEVGQVFRLNNIFFDSAKSDLRAESYGELNRLIAFLKANPQTQIELQGHTDSVGDANANQSLSESRASSCRKYLLSKGIPENQVIARGFGEAEPIADNATDTGRQQNRRVDFKILK